MTIPAQVLDAIESAFADTPPRPDGADDFYAVMRFRRQDPAGTDPEALSGLNDALVPGVAAAAALLGADPASGVSLRLVVEDTETNLVGPFGIDGLPPEEPGS